MATQDLNQIAAKVARLTTRSAASEPSKNAAAVALGRLGGLKGGKARAENLTPERRSAIAKKAAKSRWASKKK